MRRNALRGLRLYTEAPRHQRHESASARAQCGTARLLHLGSATKPDQPAIVLIPSLVNPHVILDLDERTSLARHLAARGHDPWLVDWGMPSPEDATLGLAEHIEQRLLPMLRDIDRPVILVGYCLGGTLALAAAQLLAARAQALVTIAAPWHFDRYPQDDVALIGNLWRDAKPLCERLGYAPMEVLQSGFWALDPTRTIRKYAAFADMEQGSDAHNAFLAVEDWANEGAPLTYAAARGLFEDLYGANLSGSGRWSVGGLMIDPAAIPCPSLSVRSTTDKIVPATASADLAENRYSTLGHVGMIVSRKAPEEIWTLLSDWLFAQCG